MPDPTLVTAHLRRLDPTARAAVVADCWAVAGHTVTRDGTTVRVRRAGDERLLSTVPDPDADRVMDAADLCDALLYRVARADSDRIAARHLGAPLDDLRPPRSRRAASAAQALSVPVAAVAVAALTLAIVGSGANAGGGGALPGPVYADGSTPMETTPAATAPPGVADVPGLGRAGVTDLAALAAAHERARLDSYAVWVDFERTAPDAETVTRDVDVRADGERYGAAVRVERGGTVTSEAAVYGNGETRVVGVNRTGASDGSTEPGAGVDSATHGDSRRWLAAPAIGSGEGNVTVEEIGPTETGPAGVDPDALGAEGIRQWLAAPETSVTGVEERGGARVYRVVGVGTPPTVGGGVGSYRVRALVTAEGLVVELVAEYVLVGPNRPDRRFEWSYSRGPRRVGFPAWTGLNATWVAADD